MGVFEKTGSDSWHEFYQNLWNSRGDSPVKHSAELWDERAGEWIDGIGASGDEDGAVNNRVSAAAEYLRSRGLLDGEVADVGCGPGLFVMEFAKTAGRAVGIDYSDRFIKYGQSLAEKRNLKNAFFNRFDFIESDISEAGFENAFDLAFSSLSPAVSSKGGLEKFMRISRAWCCNISVVRAADSLAERAAVDVFGMEPKTRHDGTGFHALFNLLLYSGYFPETYYFPFQYEETFGASLRYANRISRELGKTSPQDVERILRYLETASDLTAKSTVVYGSVLWNVQKRHI